MTRFPKICLAVSAVTLAVGCLMWAGWLHVAPALTLAMPVGAMAFGMFMVTLVMEKMTAEFDAEAVEKKMKPVPLEKKLPHDR